MSRLFKKSMNLIQYVSDLHLESGFARKIIPKKPNLVLLGDIGYVHQQQYENFLLETSNNFDKVFVLSGNHEYDRAKNIEEIESKIKEICYKKTNLFYIQKDMIQLCKDDDIYLVGCTFWSTLPKSKTILHYEHVDYLNRVLSTENKNFIVATHHCPLYQCLNRKYSETTPNYFASDQSDLISKINVICWIHGHSHLNKDFLYNDKPIISNQYGKFVYPIKGYKI